MPMKEGVKYKMPYTPPNHRPFKIAQYPANDNRKKGIFHQHFPMNYGCLEYALRTLTPTEFKVWMWFSSRRDQEEFVLSRQEVMKSCGISKNTYREALAALEEKDFIIKAELHSNFEGYLFIQEGPLRHSNGHTYPEEKVKWQSNTQ